MELYQIQAEYLKRDKNFIDHFCDQSDCNLTRTFNKNEDVLVIIHLFRVYTMNMI